jgi:ATP-binding cassette subfamily B protein
MVLGLIVTLFVFDWRMGLACLIAAIIAIACMFSMMGGKNAHFMQRYMQAQVDMAKAGTEYVRGIPVVKVFQQTVYSFKAFHDAIAEYSEMAENYAVKVCAKPQVSSLTVITGIAIFLVPVVIFLAPGAEAQGSAAFVDFIANFAFYAIFSAIIATAITRLMFIMEEAEISADAAKRAYGILNSPVLAESADPEMPNTHNIAFDHVSFRYEGADRDALSNVSFTVPQGTTVALVGPSGGGKTTAASLVPRFWDVTSGSVRVGGIDVRKIDGRELMESIAFVFQDNRLFKKSIYDNVAAARPDATRADVMAALAAAQCDDILAKLPDGVDTVVGADGIHLSGGEKQRIALARAICKQAPIVVLDEATAFADPENESLIQKGFAELARGRTVLMIAHRLSTVVGADKIVVIEDGHVAEQGTHDELIALSGLYARMWDEYQRAALWRITSDAPTEGAAIVKDETVVAEGGAR